MPIWWLIIAFLKCVHLDGRLRHVLSMVQRRDSEIFLEIIYPHWGLMIVSSMTRIRIGYVGRIDAIINRLGRTAMC